VARPLTGLFGTVLLAPPITRVGKKELLAVKTLVRRRSFHPTSIFTGTKTVTRNPKNNQTTGEEDGIFEP
jgi:hypothetical protein